MNVGQERVFQEEIVAMNPLPNHLFHFFMVSLTSLGNLYILSMR